VKRKAKNLGGRPLLGAERKQRFMVMLEPSLAVRLRELGGENLSRGIALVAAEKLGTTKK
jgi:hypothetical protein